MKSVLISIQPKWCELIASGKKTVEVRKTRPKIDVPFKCYIYQTKLRWVYTLLHALGCYAIARRLARGTGKVIGEFVCNKIDYWQNHWDKDVMHICDMSRLSCVSVDDLLEYLNGTTDTRGNEKKIYAWHISDLVIYDKPKGLHHFFKPCGDCDKKGTRRCTEELTDCRAKVIERPPQSWCYVDHPTEKGGAE